MEHIPEYVRRDSPICGCPLRIDGTEPYLHLDGCERSEDLQLERWLQEYGVPSDHGEAERERRGG